MYLVLMFTETLLLIATQVLLDSTRERGINFFPLQAVGEMLFPLLSVIKMTLLCFFQFLSPVLLHVSFVHSSPCL